METTVKTSKLLIVFVTAILAAIVALALTALPTQAYADYAVGTPSSKISAKYKKSKCKIVGKWKLVNSSIASERRTLNVQKKYGITNTLKFKKNGQATEKNYGRNACSYTWKAKSKKTGYLIYNGRYVCKITVSGKKLVLKANNRSRTYKKI